MFDIDDSIVVEDKNKKVYEPFLRELNGIKNDEIRLFAEKVLENVPKYFWEVASSSSGKYHPDFAAGKAGLVRHTKMMYVIFNEFIGNETIIDVYFGRQLSDMEKDMLIVAILLHDTCKLGLMDVADKYAIEHPKLVRSLCETKDIILDKPWKLAIIKIIETHMGQWVNDKITKKEVLEKPLAPSQKFLHTIDYIASRKFFDAEKVLW